MNKICSSILFIFIFSNLLLSQVNGNKFEVGELRFDGNESISKDQLLKVVTIRETPLGIWKGIYSIFDAEILGGQKPQYYSHELFSIDIKNIKQFYEDNGFFHAKIDTSVLINYDKNRVYINIKIVEGRRSFIDTIMYKGMENIPSNIIEEINTGRHIQIGDPYIRQNIDEERKRIISVFGNNGYMKFSMRDVNAYHYASTNNVKVEFIFNPGKRYTFGKIFVVNDSLSVEDVDTSIVLRHIDFVSGDFYGEQKKIESERNLNRLGIFDATKIENILPADSISQSTEIPIRILVRTRAYQELSPEIGINNENNMLNFLVGIGYNHRNFFGGARNFSTHLRFNMPSLNIAKQLSRQALKDSTTSSRAELTTQLIQPYFINNKTSLSASLSALMDKQPSYYVPSLNFRLGTQSQTALYTRLFVDWNLQLSDPKSVKNQKDTVNIQRGFIKQFNSFITTTLQRDKRNDYFYPSDGILQSFTFEEGGLIPRISNAKLPYSQYVKFAIDGQWYWDPTEKQDLTWALRLRLGVAWTYGNAPIKSIPFSQTFYSGGSGSVRGWRARSLGASMTAEQRQQGGNALAEGTLEGRWNFLKGAGKLWFIEFEKFSCVYFVDVGNIWTEPKKIRSSDLAGAFGFGLRYFTVAGPIRIDFGMKFYDPDDKTGHKWITQKRFFPETFSQGVIHLGVGHIF